MDTPDEPEFTVKFTPIENPVDQIAPKPAPMNPAESEIEFQRSERLIEAYQEDPVRNGMALADFRVGRAWGSHVFLLRQRLMYLRDAIEVLRAVAAMEDAPRAYRERLAQVLCLLGTEALDGDHFDQGDLLFVQEHLAEAVQVFEGLAHDARDECMYREWLALEGLNTALALLERAAQASGMLVPGVVHPDSRRIHIAELLTSLRGDHPCTCHGCRPHEPK